MYFISHLCFEMLKQQIEQYKAQTSYSVLLHQKCRVTHLNTGMLSKCSLLTVSGQLLNKLLVENAEDPDRSIISDTLREVLDFRKSVSSCCRLNGELRGLPHQRLQGTEVWQRRGHPHTKPQISSAVCRSTERLNLQSLCGQNS